MSPLLRLIRFSDMHEAPRTAEQKWPDAMCAVELLDLYYADGLALALAHEDPALLVDAALTLLADAAKQRLLNKGMIPIPPPILRASSLAWPNYGRSMP